MNLRIYGNRQLKTLSGRETRPTPARVREALFNIWQDTIRDCRWLDLCAGSGAMGAEALCRGAAAVVGVEQSSRACAVIQRNWQWVATPEQTIQIIRGNVLHQLPKLTGEPFDHIYFDPPYVSGLYQPVLEAIAQSGRLARHGKLAVEHAAGMQMPDIIRPHLNTGITLRSYRTKTYGGTGLTFFEVGSETSVR
jgi:16S rRNA (guanine966-N2)-methyltransferase